MTHRRVALQRFSQDEARHSRIRSAPRAALECKNAGSAAGSLRLASGELTATGDPLGYNLSLLWGNDVLLVHCPESFPRDVLMSLDAGLDVSAMPAELIVLLLELAMLPAIETLEQVTGRTITIPGMAIGARVANDCMTLVMERETRHWSLLLSDSEPRGSSSILAGLLQFWPVAPREMAGWPLAVVLRLGVTRLSIAALRSLRLGDAILLQVGDFTNGMIVVAESLTAAVRRDGAKWHVLEAPTSSAAIVKAEWTMRNGDADDPEWPDDPATDLDQLPVQLAFDIGRVELTLGELRRLGPGSIIELGRSTEEPLRIMAQGRPIGQGELVDIEGGLGVKVVKLFDYE